MIALWELGALVHRGRKGVQRPRPLVEEALAIPQPPGLSHLSPQDSQAASKPLEHSAPGASGPLDQCSQFLLFLYVLLWPSARAHSPLYQPPVLSPSPTGPVSPASVESSVAPYHPPDSPSLSTLVDSAATWACHYR